MADRPTDEPTKSGPTFVGSESLAEVGIKLLLASADRHFSEDVDLREFGVKGELSEWIIRFHKEPAKDLLSAISGGQLEPAQIVAGYIRAYGLQINPTEVSKLIENIGSLVTPEHSQQMLEARSKGNEEAYYFLFLELGKKLVASTKTSGVELEVDPGAIGTYFCRWRAAKAISRCFALHKEHPLTLMARARQGDRKAILDLVKVDKMFLHDSCTEKVIKEAELQSDQTFLEQLARAQRYKLKPSKRTRHRLVLYALFVSGSKLPTLAKLFLLLDPEGKDFKTTAAFEKFVERCRREYDTLRLAALREFRATGGLGSLDS